MTTISTPKAATPEKQAEWEALMWLLAERASATAQGKVPSPKMTPAQEATLAEMLAAADKENKPE